MIKLGDFGLAANLKSTIDSRGTFCGTSWYLAPEVFDCKMVMKSDVWSLGISLIEMADGRNPYQGLDGAGFRQAVLTKPPPTLSRRWSDAFVDFVSKCLVKEVAQRWGVDELIDVGVPRLTEA